MGAALLSSETISTTVELVTALAAETIPTSEGAGVSLVDSQGKRSVAEEWSLEELWMDYVTLGGTFVVFELEAFVCGLMPMPASEQDMLAFISHPDRAMCRLGEARGRSGH